MSERADVVVCGGGLIGLGIAWRAARAGMRVIVVDASGGRGASWAAAGMLAAVTEVHYGEEDLLALNLASARRYPGFVAELERAAGASAGYRQCGTLMVAADADDLAALAEIAHFQDKLGVGSDRLTGRELRALEPALAPGIRGGWRAGYDHEIDNRAFLAALGLACDRAGVRVVRDEVTEVLVAGGRATGVRLDDGTTIDAGAVVLAAGCWSNTIGGIPADLVPVRPVKGQLLYLRDPSGQGPIAHNVRGADVYIVGRGDGRIVVGATVEERGFDTTVTADAVHYLLRAAFELVPSLDRLELVETVCGLRPGTPDNAPIIGSAGIDGLVVATGHYRNGVLLTPVTADAVAELLATGTTPELIAPFSPVRFERARGLG